MPQTVYLISRDYSGHRTVYDTFSNYDLAKQCIDILEHNDKTNIGGWNIHTIHVPDKLPGQLTPLIHIQKGFFIHDQTTRTYVII